MFGIFVNMYLDFAQKLNKVLDGLTKCLIIPHKNPDADALGSSMALSIFLTKLGKYEDYLPNSPPNNLDWMIKNHDIISYEESPEKIKKYLLTYEIIFAQL